MNTPNKGLLERDGSEKGPQNIAFYSFIIDSLPVDTVTVNPELKVTSLNRWGQKLAGYSEKEAMWRYCGYVLRGGLCKSNCPLKAARNRKHPEMRVDSTITNRCGETTPVRMNSAALLDDKGRLIGGVEAFTGHLPSQDPGTGKRQYHLHVRPRHRVVPDRDRRVRPEDPQKCKTAR